MSILREKPSFDALTDVLAYMGVPCHVVGYDYMLAAVPLVVERCPMMELYRRTGEVCGTSWSAVERALRLAAERSVDRIGIDALDTIYGNTLPLDGVPTVSQFLVTAARMWFGMLPYARKKIS